MPRRTALAIGLASLASPATLNVVATPSAFAGEADDVLNPKKKVFEAVAPDFSVLPSGEASYKGAAFGTSGGACRLATLTAGTIR